MAGASSSKANADCNERAGSRHEAGARGANGRGDGMPPLKRKIADWLGPPWTKDDISDFLKAFQKHGHNWKQVASSLKSRTVEMVSALFSMNKAYLSLPEVSVDALFAMMTDHCNFMQDGSLSDGEDSSGGHTEGAFSERPHSTSFHRKKGGVGNIGYACPFASAVVVPGNSKKCSTPSKRGADIEKHKKEKGTKDPPKDKDVDKDKGKGKDKDKDMTKEAKVAKGAAMVAVALLAGTTGKPRPTRRRTPRGPFVGNAVEKEREKEEREEEKEEEREVEKENKRERSLKKVKDKDGDKDMVWAREAERENPKDKERENRREERESQRLKEREGVKEEKESQRLKERDGVKEERESLRLKEREGVKEERESQRLKDREGAKEERESQRLKDREGAKEERESQRLKEREATKERGPIKEERESQRLKEREGVKEERESQRLKEREGVRLKERERQKSREKDNQRAKDREYEKEKEKEREREKEMEKEREKEREIVKEKEKGVARKKTEKEKKSKAKEERGATLIPDVLNEKVASGKGLKADSGLVSKEKLEREKDNGKEKDKQKSKEKAKQKEKRTEDPKVEKEKAREPASPGHSPRKSSRARQVDLKTKAAAGMESGGAVPTRLWKGDADVMTTTTMDDVVLKTGGLSEGSGRGHKRLSENTSKSLRATTRTKLVSKVGTHVKGTVPALSGKNAEVSEVKRKGPVSAASEVASEPVLRERVAGGDGVPAAAAAGGRRRTEVRGEEEESRVDAPIKEGGVENESGKKKPVRRTKSVNMPEKSKSEAAPTVPSPHGRKGVAAEREEKMLRRIASEVAQDENGKKSKKLEREKGRERDVGRSKEKSKAREREHESQTEGELEKADEGMDEDKSREAKEAKECEVARRPIEKRKVTITPRRPFKKIRHMYSDNGSGLDALATLAEVSLNGLLPSPSEEATLVPRVDASGSGAGEDGDDEGPFPSGEQNVDTASNPSSRTLSTVSTPETVRPAATSAAWSPMSPPSHSQQLSSPSTHVPRDTDSIGGGPQPRGGAPSTPRSSDPQVGPAGSASASLVQSVSPVGDIGSSPTMMSSEPAASGPAREGVYSGGGAVCAGAAIMGEGGIGEATPDKNSPTRSGAGCAQSNGGAAVSRETVEANGVVEAVADDSSCREGAGAAEATPDESSHPTPPYEARKRKRKSAQEKLPVILSVLGKKTPDPPMKPRNKTKRGTPGKESGKDGGSKHGSGSQRPQKDECAISSAREGEDVGGASSGGSDLGGTAATPAPGDESALPLKLRSKKQRMGGGTGASGSISGGANGNGSVCDGVDRRVTGGAMQSSVDEICTHPKEVQEGARDGSRVSAMAVAGDNRAEHGWAAESPKLKEPTCCTHVTHGLKGASTKARLMHCVLSPQVQKWCMYEWFYSAIDLPWLARNEFVEYLQHLGLGHIARLTRVEWGEIRSSLGKPRRLSQAFLREERGKLALHRELSRNHYQEMRNGQHAVDAFPPDLAKPLAVGQRVTARHPKKGQIHDGSVLTVDRGRCRVQFDRTDLGVELVQDVDVMPVNPMENMPDSMKRRKLVDGYDDARGRFGLALVSGVPLSGNIGSERTPMGNNSVDQANALIPAAGGNLLNSQVAIRRAPGEGGRPADVTEGTSVATVGVNGPPSIVSSGASGTPIQKLSIPQASTREADVRALGALARVLDKKDLLLSELRRMNDEVESGTIAVDGPMGEGAGKADAFQRQYATVVLQLKEINKQVEVALLKLRQRNKYHDSSLPPWQKGSPQPYSATGPIYGEFPPSPSNMIDHSHLALSEGGSFSAGLYGGVSAGGSLGIGRVAGAGVASGFGGGTGSGNMSSTVAGTSNAGTSTAIETPFPIGEMAATARRQARAMVASVVQLEVVPEFERRKMEHQDFMEVGKGSAIPVQNYALLVAAAAAAAKGLKTSEVVAESLPPSQNALTLDKEGEEQGGRSTSSGGLATSGGAASDGTVGTASDVCGRGGGGVANGGGGGTGAGEIRKDGSTESGPGSSGPGQACPSSKGLEQSSSLRSGRPPLVPPDPLVGINPLIMPGTAKEAALLTELMASCVATLLMIQNCTERALPHSDVVLTLDSALSSLRPHDSSNNAVFKEIERSISTIKSQIVAEVPATHVP